MMRQHPHERNTPLPGRCVQYLPGWNVPYPENQHFPYRENFMHLREPPFFTFMYKRPQFIGLLGSAPVNAPHHLGDMHHMMWPLKHPMNVKHKGNCSNHRPENQSEMERSSGPPGADDFIQMAWRTGIQRDRSMGHSCSNHREGETKSNKKHKNRRRKKSASPRCYVVNSTKCSDSVSNKCDTKEGTSENMSTTADHAQTTERKSLFEELEEGEIGVAIFSKAIDAGHRSNEIVDISSDSIETEIRNSSDSAVANHAELDTGSSRSNKPCGLALDDNVAHMHSSLGNKMVSAGNDKIKREEKQTSRLVDDNDFPKIGLFQHVNKTDEISLQSATSKAQSPEHFGCCSKSGEKTVAQTGEAERLSLFSSFFKSSISDHALSSQSSNSCNILDFSIVDKSNCSPIDINIPVDEDQRRESTICASISGVEGASYRMSQDQCFNGDHDSLRDDQMQCDRKHSRCNDNVNTIPKKLCLEKNISLTCASHANADNGSTSEIQNNAVEKGTSPPENYHTRIPDLNLSHSENDLDCETTEAVGETSYFTSPLHSEVKNPVKLRMKLRDPRRVFMEREKHISNNVNVVMESSTGSSCQSTKDDISLNQSANEDISFTKASMSHPKSRYKKMNTHKSLPAEGPSSWQNPHLFKTLDGKLREERTRRIEEQNQMLNARKLSLVLDLDHTLLNSAKFSEMDEELEVMLSQMNTLNRQNEGSIKDLYRLPEMGMWTKLRPGVQEFLARASQLCELHVSTMGNKAYAMEMTKLLDPTGTLFAGRVISRGAEIDCLNSVDMVPKSKDLEGVLGLESAVIIIDDSVQVWPHHRLNLLEVERYMYFPSTRRQFNLPGLSLLEIRHDERAVDGMLASVLKVIEKIHSTFFSAQPVSESDVRCILAAEKRNVLAGCKIVFSRVYPQGESQPHLYPLWQKAEEFGAACTMTIDDSVTHVVAISRGTDKVKWGTQTGRFCVSPGWLEASAVLYRRANEHDFPVPP